MSDFAAVRRRDVEIERPRKGSLEDRGARALRLLAFLNFAGVAFAIFPQTVPVSTLFISVINVAAAALGTLELGVAFGLDRKRPWAVAAVRPLLVIVFALGAYTVAVEWSRGTIRIPFEVALAAWPFLGPADVKPLASLERRSVLALGAGAALVAVLASASRLFDYGGTFDVHEPDLKAVISADCGPAGGGPPDVITVRYDWSWAATSPMPSGADMVVIGWTGSDPEGRPLYVLDATPDAGAGIYPGRTGYPSMDMADAIARESQGSFRWAIQLPEQKLAPGRIELRLQRARDAAPSPLSLTVSATYVHVGIWRHAAASVTCSW